MSFRYLGNKARIASWIADTIQQHVPAGGVIADPMCGTATVCVALAQRGYRVEASDQLLFPVLHARSRLLVEARSNFRPTFESYEDAVCQLNATKSLRGLFWREYSNEGSPLNGCKARSYFTGENAAKIDGIRRQILDWRLAGLRGAACDILLNDLMLAVNRVANIAGTYGYYRSSWNSASLRPIELVPYLLEHSTSGHMVRHGKVEDLAPTITSDAVYLDPPYTKRQYGGNYHILETIAQEDEPEPVGEGGLRDWYPHASDFCYRRKAADAFRSALRNLRVPLVFVSYSEDAHLSPEDMLGLLGEFGTVHLERKNLERFRSNSRVRKLGDVEEHLYVLETHIASAVRHSGALVAEDIPERPLQHRAVAA